ncbi:cyclic nucleotide-binding domain-containing protein [Nannocystis punicea]|uniref:Cyclic nucleotide-binding domain-containing protein n=1 Tax=Nannocystis punicea TaxID=2995304 RepID=A0ABY7GWD1_9BACT|nr:cyclic nucleotide-binding domain-containing protein [Nannocystis poenicansa]WAS91266.1 cyclic nucleotide-binding domain-containing protein [Nannocystis poenicansa]
MNAPVGKRRERVVRSEAVVPATMSAAERDALADALLAVYAEIFAGATREYIVHGMVSPKSEFTTILLHRNAEDRIVGYFAIHFLERRFRGVPTTVVRSSVGMLRAYRGRNANIGWALGVLLKQRLAHPGRPMYGMGSFVHPSSYLQVARYVDVFWPRPEEPVPPDMHDFIVELADEFQMRRIDAEQPLIRAGSMPTRESEAERDYWRRSDKPAVRFFIAMNPAYSQGNGLVTMFPITASMLTGIASRIARERARLLMEGTLAVVQRLPLVDRLLRPRAVRRQLQAVPLFAALDGADLQRVVELASVVALPAGHTLFREGDAGDELYVVARGAVAVQATAAEGEGMIDQLGSGSLFGEIAVLAGGRRRATVRTVIPTTLVRIPGPALRAAMQRAPLGEAIWEVFAARIFDDHLRAVGRHRQLGRDERFAWARRGRTAELEAGVRLPVVDAAFVIVASGDVLVEQGGAQLSAQAPVVVEVTPSTVVKATTRARTVHVPRLEEARPTAEAS